MSGNGGFINLGDLSKPATVLIEKISDAIGGIFRPYQIRRVAEAQAEAEKTRAISQIEINELQHRAISRFFIEEANKQHNIETITEKALPLLNDGASPQNIENDWIANFFDKCRLISDDEMQTLWSRVLAGEASGPGRYSKRTVNLIASLDKADAELFGKVCSFAWQIREVVPLIYDHDDRMYVDSGLNFDALRHLQEIGLISFEPLGYCVDVFAQKIGVSFHGKPFEIELPPPDTDKLQTGDVLLTRAGQELASICESAPCPGFEEYILARWRDMGLTVKELA